MKLSLAKNFEHNVKAQLSDVKDVYVLRLYDTMFAARGIRGIILVWFYDKDTTLAIDIRKLVELKNNGDKSIRYDATGDGIIKVEGEKSRLYFKYDFDAMLNEVRKWK